MTKKRNIEDETGIDVGASANAVLDLAKQVLGLEKFYRVCDDSIAYGYLVGCAETTYANNAEFRHRIKTRASPDIGRNRLHSHMQKWLASRLSSGDPDVKRTLARSGFSVGAYSP